MSFQGLQTRPKVLGTKPWQEIYVKNSSNKRQNGKHFDTAMFHAIQLKNAIIPSVEAETVKDVSKNLQN